MTARDLSLSALFASLTAVCAQISVTLPVVTTVPFTLQVFAVLLAGAVLGARLGCVSQLVYVLLGAAGAPVFARLHGGPQVVLGPTGGYLWAFPLAALTVGWAAEIAARTSRGALARAYLYGGMVVGLGFVYVFGVAGLLLTGVVHSLPRAVQVGVLPFFWLDLIKAYLAGVVAAGVRAALRSGVRTQSAPSWRPRAR